MKCGLSAFIAFLPSVSMRPSEKHPTSFWRISFPSSHNLGGDDISRCLPFSWGVTAAVRGSLCQIFPESLRYRQEVDLMASAWSVAVLSRTLTLEQVIQDWRDFGAELSWWQNRNHTIYAARYFSSSWFLALFIFFSWFLLPDQVLQSIPRWFKTTKAITSFCSRLCTLGRTQQGELASPLLIFIWGGLKVGLEHVLICPHLVREDQTAGDQNSWVSLGMSWNLYMIFPYMVTLGKPDFLCGNSGTNDLQRSRPSLKSHAVSQLPHFWLKQCDSPSTFKGKEFRPSRELASLIAQLVKNLPAMQETWVWLLGQEDPLATHSSILD